MVELIKVQCPCGTVFQTLPEVGTQDWDGNFRCDNCAVELGLKEGLVEEPPAAPPPPLPEGSDVEVSTVAGDIAEEKAEVPVEPPKVDLRTKEGRAIKAAQRAAEAT